MQDNNNLRTFYNFSSGDYRITHTEVVVLTIPILDMFDIKMRGDKNILEIKKHNKSLDIYPTESLHNVYGKPKEPSTS